MDLNLTGEETAFRDELRAWLDENVPQPWDAGSKGKESAEYSQYLRDWQRKLFEGGWAGVSWPQEYGGRDATPIQQSIVHAELIRAKAPEQLGVIGEGLVGPTVMAVGTPEQKARFLPRILSGEEVWCQGFSEPNAGSDVAALATRAARDGDEWVVNGQKIWTSFAHIADWCLLLVRTDPSAPKHKGITTLLVDMKSPGVSVRPLRQMSGDSGFNEVFFTDVRVPVANQLGETNQGWGVAITVLMNERASLGSSMYVLIDQAVQGLIQQARLRTLNGKRLADDPINRQKIAQAVAELEVYRLNVNRSLSKLNKGQTPGADGSMLKIFWSEMYQRIAQTAMEVLGDISQLRDFDDGRWAYRYLRSRGATIEGGTSEIQRLILAERVLGLPKSY
ncbi:MAG: acyl-CoA dehydrogenase [Planctomycetaceae bacterium]